MQIWQWTQGSCRDNRIGGSQYGSCQEEANSSNYIKPQGNWSDLSTDKVSSHFWQTEHLKSKYWPLQFIETNLMWDAQQKPQIKKQRWVSESITTRKTNFKTRTRPTKQDFHGSHKAVLSHWRERLLHFSDVRRPLYRLHTCDCSWLHMIPERQQHTMLWRGHRA